MKVMVVGTGGREHALVAKLAEAPSITEVVVTGTSCAHRCRGRGRGTTGVHARERRR